MNIDDKEAWDDHLWWDYMLWCKDMEAFLKLRPFIKPIAKNSNQNKEF